MHCKDFNKTIDDFKKLSGLRAIVLGGSRATLQHDQTSDYDVYVYTSTPIPIEKRYNILKSTCSHLEINNDFWEPEDDCILNSGTTIELIYRNMEQTRKDMENILVKYNASCGYSTCLCYNVFNSKPLYDPYNEYKDLQQSFSLTYPTKLQENIINKNRALLTGNIPSYYYQIEKAVKREDVVSVNHRTAEFLASYFDIIFALNQKYHPGEKRLISTAKSICPVLPKNFEENLHSLLCSNSSNNILATISSIILELDKLLWIN